MSGGDAKSRCVLSGWQTTEKVAKLSDPGKLPNPERVSEPSDTAFLLFLTAGDTPAEVKLVFFSFTALRFEPKERVKTLIQNSLDSRREKKSYSSSKSLGGLKILFRMRDKGVRRNMTWLRVENPAEVDFGPVSIPNVR
ncbi:hypothetical protein RUM43_002674 [Polyplax serrata]|uniref:Uncharacterized protein n=1 Tax=Polyplax serrata TaxID=468196 RepID=A0AAN8PD50_POLSC